MKTDSPLGVSLQTLGQLIDQKLPLVDALERSAAICGNSKLRHAWLRISEKIKSGVSFNDAIQNENELPANYKNLISLAMNSPNGSKILFSLAAHFNAKVAVQRTMANYITPLITLLFTTVAFGCVWSFYLSHHLRLTYSCLNVPTPVYVNPVFSTIWVIPALVVVLFMIRWFFGRGTIGSSSITRLLNISTSLQGLSVFVSAGVPLHAAMKSVAFQGFNQAASELENGETLQVALDTRCPDSLAIILENANQTGCLDTVCNRLSTFYKKLAIAKLRTITMRLIPILLLISSLIAGLAIFTGYYSYIDTVKSVQGAFIW